MSTAYFELEDLNRLDNTVIDALMDSIHNEKEITLIVTARPLSCNMSTEDDYMGFDERFAYRPIRQKLEVDMVLTNIIVPEKVELGVAQYANDIALGVVETDDKNCTLIVDKVAKWEDMIKTNDEEDDEPISKAPDKEEYFY